MLLVTGQSHGPRKAALDQQGWASRHCLELLVNALEVWSDVGHHASLHHLNESLLQLTDSLTHEHDEYVLSGKVVIVKLNLQMPLQSRMVAMHVQSYMHVDGLTISP